jgi:hypothetical protein
MKRSLSPNRGKPCCYRFRLPETSNAELTYDGRRLLVTEGRRVKPKGGAPTSSVIDPDMFSNLGLAGRAQTEMTEIIEWAARTWPELGWEAATLPYKVVVQAIHDNIMLVFTFAESRKTVHVGDMHQQPAATRNGWVEWVGCWRVVIPLCTKAI